MTEINSSIYIKNIISFDDTVNFFFAEQNNKTQHEVKV